MRKLVVCFVTVILSGASLCAKTAQEMPQTARQALLEMFSGKEPGTFLKHLPAVTRATLEQSGALANLQQYSVLTSQIQSQNKNFQTYETGSVLFATADPKTGQKIEIIVESDSLNGEQDDIELSFQTYKDGQPKRTPFMPHMTFSMKMESGIWKLNEISVTIRVPLTDPDLLKTISDGMKAHAATTSASVHPTMQITMQPQTHPFGSGSGFDASVLNSMRTILTAEITYSATYPTVGFTCTLSELDGFGGGEPNEHQAMLINSSLASGKRYGYTFQLSQCGGTPPTSFHLTATPIGEAYGRRAFCTDQSGAIKASADGNAATCLSSGTSAQ